MSISEQDLKAIALIKDVPVNIQTDGMTAFMLIAQLQLALRHPGNDGESAEKIRDLAIDLQNQLILRSSELKPILDKGWHPEFDLDIDERNKEIVEVHNVYTLYESEEGEADILSMYRSQDWGDPKWHYEFIKLEWKYKGILYIQNAHVWTTSSMTPPEILGRLGEYVGMIAQPGRAKELCDRSHLDEDDFWCEEWGEMPPYYQLPDSDIYYFDKEQK